MSDRSTTFRGTFEIVPNLSENPHTVYRQWLKAVLKFLGNLMSGSPLHPYGMVFLALSFAQLAALPMMMEVDEHGALIHPNPPDFPRPAPLAAGAGAGSIQNHKIAMDLHLSHLDITQYARRSILHSIGAVNEEAITDPFSQVVILDTYAIMQAMHIRFGVQTAAGISELKLQLLEPIQAQDAQAFRGFAIAYTNIIMDLARADCPVNEYDAMTSFTIATSGFPAINSAIDRYTNLHPMLADRSLAALVAYVESQLASVTTQASGFANAATNSFVTAAFVHEAVADGFALYARRQRDHNVTPGGTATRDTSKYCFHHGHCAHSGSECRYMGSTLAKTERKFFTRAQILASDSSTGGRK